MFISSNSESEKILHAINTYLMAKFEYKTPPAFFSTPNVTIHARRKKIKLHLRLIREGRGGFWQSDTFVIALIEFNKKRKGYGRDLLQFLSALVSKNGFRFIGIESTNIASSQFAKKFGFTSYKSSEQDYIVAVEDLIDRFQKDI
jgi:hypothetical protein